MKIIDLRSDTVTQPTPEMREAMYAAEVGDDVYGDDPTINALEKTAAAIAGKEASLFVPSGTFGNQLALFTHCKHGNEVILGENCHIVQHEAGASSVITGVQLRTYPDGNGGINPDEIESRIRKDKDIHYPDTGLICLENAHSDGTVIPLADMKEVSGLSRRYGIPIHLDGARLFNASTHLGINPGHITGLCDSVMFCLSKGLCAPVGSILAGSREFVDKARRGRKLMGGGMRQAGILAAAGLIALENMTHRLGEDHENAILLAQELAKIPGVKVNPDKTHINMVFFDINGTGYDTVGLTKALNARGIKVNPGDDGIMRFVTHHLVDAADIRYVAECTREYLS